MCATVHHKGGGHHLPHEHSQTGASGLGRQSHRHHAHCGWVRDQVFSVIICSCHSVLGSSAMLTLREGHGDCGQMEEGGLSFQSDGWAAGWRWCFA